MFYFLFQSCFIDYISEGIGNNICFQEHWKRSAYRQNMQSSTDPGDKDSPSLQMEWREAVKTRGITEQDFFKKNYNSQKKKKFYKK